MCVETAEAQYFLFLGNSIFPSVFVDGVKIILNEEGTEIICMYPCGRSNSGKNFIEQVDENEIDPRPEKRDCLEIREICSQLQCAYGVERSVDEKDCVTCHCHNPCKDLICPTGTVCTVDPYYHPESDGAQLRAICQPVPVRANITLYQTTYPVSSDISISCQVEGYPIPHVTWYKDDAILENSERIQPADPNRIIILRANTSDTGTYQCKASNAYNSSSSSISIIVEGPYIHPNCTDKPYFANCVLIVKANFCTNRYYGRFCCRSCTLAGQFPSHGLHLDEHGLPSGSGRRQRSTRK